MPGDSSEPRRDERGASLIELMIAVSVLSVAVLGLAGVMAAGMRQLGSAPVNVIAAQKASQAVESVFAARDSHRLAWNQIRNVNGAGGDGGVFVDGPRALYLAGPDGLVNTADDPSTVESAQLPGPDQALGTYDDRRLALDGFTREIIIRDVPNSGGLLRSITVIIRFWTNSGAQDAYTLVTYISSYA